MVVAGVPQLHKLGITKKELIPLSNGIRSADNSGLGLLGGILLNISGQCEDGTVITTRQLCYIAEGIDCLFLSRQASFVLARLAHTSVGVCNVHAKSSQRHTNHLCVQINK